MVSSLERALMRVKSEWAEAISAGRIEALCRAAGHRWRERLLGPVTTVQLFLLQMLHGNTAITHLSHLCGWFVDDASYCAARQRLPLAVLQGLLSQTTDGLHSAVVERWRGLRVWLVDGSACSMPDTPELARHFGYPANQRPGCGFPVAHLLGLFDAASGLCRQVLATPLDTHDVPQMPALFGDFQPGDVLVADRGFCSWGHLASLMKQGVSATFRVHASQRVDFRPGRPHHRRTHHAAPRSARGRPGSEWVRTLGFEDQLVRWFKPPQRPRWLSREEYVALPDALLVRELRYVIATPGFRTQSVMLVTTLVDPQAFPPGALAELYHWRWQIEGHFRELKTTLRLETLKCHHVEGVLKELVMLALVYNLVHAVRYAAAHQRGVPVDRLSFTDAWRWLRADSPLPLSQLVVNPLRPGRHEPRAVKRRPKPYPLLTKPRPNPRNSSQQHPL